MLKSEKLNQTAGILSRARINLGTNCFIISWKNFLLIYKKIIFYFSGSSTPSTSRATSLNGDSYWSYFLTSFDLHLASQSSTLTWFWAQKFRGQFFLLSSFGGDLASFFLFNFEDHYFTLSLWATGHILTSRQTAVLTVNHDRPIRRGLMQWNYTSHIYLSKSRLFMSRNDNLNILYSFAQDFFVDLF